MKNKLMILAVTTALTFTANAAQAASTQPMSGIGHGNGDLLLLAILVVTTVSGLNVVLRFVFKTLRSISIWKSPAPDDVSVLLSRMARRSMPSGVPASTMAPRPPASANSSREFPAVKNPKGFSLIS